MTINSGTSDNDRSPIEDPSLAVVLREVYAAPEGDGYWSDLEDRIMARIRKAGEQGEWWSVFAEWRTAGLVAAALLLTLAGTAFWQESKKANDLDRLANHSQHWTVFDGPTDDMNIAFSVPSPAGSADRYMFSAEP